MGRLAFKTEQLLYRQLEVYLAHALFDEFVSTPFDVTLGRCSEQAVAAVSYTWHRPA